MASIDVGIHPDAAGITTKHFPGGPPASFSTLEIWVRESHVAVFVDKRAVLEALQAALREIETDMGRAEQAAMKAAQTASIGAEIDQWAAQRVPALPEAAS